MSSNHCRSTAHYKLFLKAKTKVITNRETKEHHTLVPRLTYLKKYKMGQIRQFQPFFVSFVIISFALRQGLGTCSNSLTGPLCCSLQANCKLIFHTTTNYESCLACQHFFQIRPITNCKRDKPIKNINICPCDSPNTMMCTNLQTLCTGGLEYLQWRLIFPIKTIIKYSLSVSGRIQQDFNYVVDISLFFMFIARLYHDSSSLVWGNLLLGFVNDLIGCLDPCSLGK